MHGEVIELVSGKCLAFEVQDLDEKYVYGMLIDHPFSFEYLTLAVRCRRLLHSEYTERAGLSPSYSCYVGMKEAIQIDQKLYYMESRSREKWLDRYAQIMEQKVNPSNNEVEEFIRRREKRIAQRRRSLLKREQAALRQYRETGCIPVNYIYLVWKNGKWPSGGEPRTLEVELEPRHRPMRNKKII